MRHPTEPQLKPQKENLLKEASPRGRNTDSTTPPPPPPRPAAAALPPSQNPTRERPTPPLPMAATAVGTPSSSPLLSPGRGRVSASLFRAAAGGASRFRSPVRLLFVIDASPRGG